MKATITNKSLLMAALVIVTAIVGWLVWRSRNAVTVANLDSSGTSVVAFGDSLVYGYGSSPEHGFVSLLSARLGLPIVNLGVNGDTTATGLARLDSVFAQDPRVVIVLLGGNDFLRQVPAETVFANLGAIIDTIQAHGSAVLLLGVRGGLLGDAYAARFEALAKEHHAAFVPNVLDGLIGHSDLMYDSIHPNDSGYARIADKVYPALRDMLSE